MFLYCDWIVCAAFDGCIVGEDHTFLPLHQSNTCDDPCRGSIIFVHIPGCQGAEFQKGCLGVTQSLNAFSRQKFVAFAMFDDSIFPSTLLYQLYTLAK